MADLSITAASVIPDAGFTYRDLIAAGTLTAGQPVYIDSSNSNKATTASTTNATTANVVGITLHGASVNQPIRVMTGGTYAVGAAVLVGVPYFNSDNAGGIAVLADSGTGDYVTVLFMAISTTKGKLCITASGGSKA